MVRSATLTLFLLIVVGCDKGPAPTTPRPTQAGAVPAPSTVSKVSPAKAPQESADDLVAAVKRFGGRAMTLGGRFTGSVDLSGTKVTNADLTHFKHRDDLQILKLSDTEVGDEGLADMATSTALNVLELDGTKVTNEGLKALQHAPNLLLVNVKRTAVSSLDNLSGTPQLKRVGLDSSQVTDDGLKGAAAIPNLEALTLSDTKITDAGLKHLKAVSKLNVLDVRQTRVTDAGVADLKQALPKLFAGN